jgi:streptogramin lyase
LFVVDSRNHRVQKFTLDGGYLSQFGGFGDGPGQLNTPWGIGLDKECNVFVADWRNDRIQSFTADGKWLASFGQPGSGGDASIARQHGGIRVVSRPVGLFNRPSGVCVDKDGDIYVADWLNNRVQVLTPEGRFITEFTGDAALSKWGVAKIESNPDMIRQRNGVRDFTPEKVLWTPVAVKVDDQGRVIVVDTNRHRFQLYQKNTEPVIV